MKECFTCCLFSMLIGAVVGGTLVVSNSKIEKAVKKGKDFVEDKIDDVKQKIEKSKTKKSNNSQN